MGRGWVPIDVDTARAIQRDLRRMRHGSRSQIPGMNFARTLAPTMGSGILLRATADIANGSSETCNRVTLDEATPTEDTSDTADAPTVYNVLLPKIWSDCYLVANYLGGELVATLAYSATLVWGQLTADCSGGTFSVDGVVGLDGDYPAGGTIADVNNPFGMSGDEDGDVIISWVDQDATPKWVGIQMECPA